MSCANCHRSGCAAESLAQQRNRQVGPPGSVRRALGQEDRAEPVGDVEAWVERRRQIEERIELVVSSGPVAVESFVPP